MVPAGNILLVSYHTFTVKNGLPFCKGGSSESRKPPSFLIGFMPCSSARICFPWVPLTFDFNSKL